MGNLRLDQDRLIMSGQMIEPRGAGPDLAWRNIGAYFRRIALNRVGLAPHSVGSGSMIQRLELMHRKEIDYVNSQRACRRFTVTWLGPWTAFANRFEAEGAAKI